MAVIQDPKHPTGVSTEPKNEGKEVVIRARERKANAALELLTEGMDPVDIAEILGYPDGRAVMTQVELALERQVMDNPNREAMRQLASKRLDSLLRSVWKKAHDPEHPEHLPAHKRASDVIAQWTRLHGVEAPSEVVVHSPSEGEISAWVAQVTKGKVPQVEELDIFDADLVDEPLEIES